jgi:hypothetical protein
MHSSLSPLPNETRSSNTHTDDDDTDADQMSQANRARFTIAHHETVPTYRFGFSLARKRQSVGVQLSLPYR